MGRFKEAFGDFIYNFRELPGILVYRWQHRRTLRQRYAERVARRNVREQIEADAAHRYWDTHRGEQPGIHGLPTQPLRQNKGGK